MTAEDKCKVLQDLLAWADTTKERYQYMQEEIYAVSTPQGVMIVKGRSPQQALDVVSRTQTDKEKIKSLLDMIQDICDDQRQLHVDESVCGLCEYDADHGIDGYANECPGFETDECFKLSEEFKKKYIEEEDRE